jgi:hypothetical protein
MIFAHYAAGIRLYIQIVTGNGGIVNSNYLFQQDNDEPVSESTPRLISRLLILHLNSHWLLFLTPSSYSFRNRNKRKQINPNINIVFNNHVVLLGFGAV